MPYSFNVLLTTIGRPTLYNMLLSLENQLNKEDYLTIVIDHKEVADFVFSLVLKLHLKCTVTVIVNSQNLGYYGHGSRSRYQNNLLGDFIINADDDDTFLENAFEAIRENATNKNTLYLFKMVDCAGFTYWNEDTRKNGVKIGNIGTPCGVIPNNKKLPNWGNEYGGDGQFYIDITTSPTYIRYELIDSIIYKVKH